MSSDERSFSTYLKNQLQNCNFSEGCSAQEKLEIKKLILASDLSEDLKDIVRPDKIQQIKAVRSALSDLGINASLKDLKEFINNVNDHIK